MPGATDLKKNAILPLQRDLAIVQAPRHIHDAISVNEIVTAWRRRVGRALLGLSKRRFDAGCHVPSLVYQRSCRMASCGRFSIRLLGGRTLVRAFSSPGL